MRKDGDNVGVKRFDKAIGEKGKGSITGKGDNVFEVLTETTVVRGNVSSGSWSCRQVCGKRDGGSRRGWRRELG